MWALCSQEKECTGGDYKRKKKTEEQDRREQERQSLPLTQQEPGRALAAAGKQNRQPI